MRLTLLRTFIVFSFFFCCLSGGVRRDKLYVPY